MKDPKPRHGRAGEKRPCLPFYALDWLGSMRVRRMTPAQRGWYVEGLCMQWTEGPLPEDPVKFARLFPGASEEDLAELLDVFPVADGGGRLNHRLERERGLAEDRSEAQKKLGQAGNDARWREHREKKESATGSRSDPAGVPHRSRKASETDPISSPPAPAPAPAPAPDSDPSPSERCAAPVADAPAPLPARKALRVVPDTPHHQTIDRWCRAYRESVGEDYAFQAKDAAAVKTMLKTHTPDRILAQAERLLFCESAFHAEHRTLCWLSAKWNEIGQLAHANSLRLEGVGAKVVREAARSEAAGQRPQILDWIESDEPKRLKARSV